MEHWKDNRLVNYIFFSDNDILRKGTKEYDDFWLFLEKYERFRRSKKAPESSTLQQNKYEFPDVFNKRYKINLAVSTTTIKEKYKDYRARYSGRKDSLLTIEELSDFKQIILFYFDFLQKQKFGKLLKLKEDQRNLPIWKYKEQIIYAVKSNKVVIIAGDTGCGKSTQVPQYLLHGGFTNIACTQPRKIACVSLAKRVGFETLNEYKSDVAFQVRFETSKTKQTKVLFLTEGVLLRQFQSDPELSMYNVVVVDEVHERHMNGDFLLGVLKCLLQQRSDLRLILMSATINIELFTNYFDSAPVVQVPGRLYPIDLQYVAHFIDKEEANNSSKSERLNPSPYLRIMQLVDKKYPSSERGDLLIFMSGMSEISAVVDAAREYALKTNAWIILPLHSALPIEEQDKIFDIPPEGVRKCIVSTNIAETSITIDGVRFVADSGKVKEMRYDPQVKMQRLQEFWISQASAEQRKGRAGRTGPGVCFRLYSAADYDSFSQYSTSEIHRVPLDSLVLQMASLGLHDATLFPFIEPPPKSSLVNSTYLLKQQGALSHTGELTPIGRMLSRLPVDITLGKMLVMGSLFSLVDPVLIIAAALSVQSPLTRRFSADNDSDCEHRRRELFSKHGDPFTLLNVYDEWILVKSERKSNSKKWCKRRGIEEQRLYELSKLKQQFETILKDYGLLGKVNRNRVGEYSKKQMPRRELLQLKRAHHSQKGRKRKLLKLHRIGFEGESDDESEEEEDEAGQRMDIHDIDFKLRHNLASLEATSKRNRKFTYRDINLLKLIITSGLFPQVAMADESNPWRKQTEQVFHSKDKQFILLHPTAVYSLQPDFLDSLYSDPNESRKACEGHRTSSRELLIYVSLLETNKPYIINSMKVPALQSLFLLSTNISTNSDCSKVVFDDWIELSFEEDFERNDLLCKVVRLRKSWDALLEEKLFLYDEDEKDEIHRKLSKIKRLEKIVSLKLAEFLDTDIKYKLRRLTSADAKYMYVGQSNAVTEKTSQSDAVTEKASQSDAVTEKTSQSNAVTEKTSQSDAVTEKTSQSDNPNDNIPPIENEKNANNTSNYLLQSGKVNKIKGGIDVTPYLTFACLRDDLSLAVASRQADYLVEHYHCPDCNEHIIGTIIQRIQHNEVCGILEDESQVKSDNTDDEGSENVAQKKVSGTSYFCDFCQSEYQFTPVEILKHKLTHR